MPSNSQADDECYGAGQCGAGHRQRPSSARDDESPTGSGWRRRQDLEVDFNDYRSWQRKPPGHHNPMPEVSQPWKGQLPLGVDFRDYSKGAVRRSPDHHHDSPNAKGRHNLEVGDYANGNVRRSQDHYYDIPSPKSGRQIDSSAQRDSVANSFRVEGFAAPIPSNSNTFTSLAANTSCTSSIASQNSPNVFVITMLILIFLFKWIGGQRQ